MIVCMLQSMQQVADLFEVGWERRANEGVKVNAAYCKHECLEVDRGISKLAKVDRRVNVRSGNVTISRGNYPTKVTRLDLIKLNFHDLVII